MDNKTLYHECGHAYMGMLLGWDIVSMTIDGNSGECVASIPSTTEATHNQVRLYNLGGAAAEIAIFGQIVTDCHGLWGDIQASRFTCWIDFEKNAHAVAQRMSKDLLQAIARSYHPTLAA